MQITVIKDSPIQNGKWLGQTNTYEQSDAFILWFPEAKTISYQNEGTEGADASVSVHV